MLTIRGVHNYHPRDLASRPDVPRRSRTALSVGDLWSAPSYPLEQAEQAFAHAHARPGVRVAVVP